MTKKIRLPWWLSLSLALFDRSVGVPLPINERNVAPSSGACERERFPRACHARSLARRIYNLVAFGHILVHCTHTSDFITPYHLAISLSLSLSLSLFRYSNKYMVLNRRYQIGDGDNDNYCQGSTNI